MHTYVCIYIYIYIYTHDISPRELCGSFAENCGDSVIFLSSMINEDCGDLRRRRIQAKAAQKHIESWLVKSPSTRSLRKTCGDDESAQKPRRNVSNYVFKHPLSFNDFPIPISSILFASGVSF